MSQIKTLHQRFGMVCPHCQSKTKVRSSEKLSPITRGGYIECRSVACGWRGRFIYSIESTITQSAKPNPNVTLPLITP